MMKVCFPYQTADGRQAFNNYGLVWEEEKGFTRIPFPFQMEYEKRMMWACIRVPIATLLAGTAPQIIPYFIFGQKNPLFVAFIALSMVVAVGMYAAFRLSRFRRRTTLALAKEWMDKEGEL